MPSTPRIWLDSAATTPLSTEVAEAIDPWLRGGAGGNPSSLHAEGRAARRAIEDVRDWFAGHFHVPRSQVHFTASATEANNLALAGAIRALASGRTARVRVAASAVEHDSVHQCLLGLAREGLAEVAWVPVRRTGDVDLAAATEVLRQGAELASLMHVNNETGVVQPIGEWARRARATNPAIILHCDAVQSFARLEVDIEAADLWVLCGHKMHAPAGAGVLIRQRPIDLRPLMLGGPQEGGLRGGTENVAAIVGLGVAARLAVARREAASEHLRALADAFLATLSAEGVEAELRAEPGTQAPGMLCVTFSAAASEDLVIAADLEGMALSAGSACHSGVPEPSRILGAMGLDGETIRHTVRIVFHRDQPLAEAREAAHRIARILRRTH